MSPLRWTTKSTVKLADALTQRGHRTSMKTQGLAGIPLYPELRNCPAPSAPRILGIFNDVKRRRLERADLPAATHTATTAGPGPPKHPSKHLHLTPPSGGLYRLREVRNVSPGDPSCRFEFRVFRHECGSPNGFELGFLLLRQRFWAGAAGLWFVPVLRRFFSGSRQFG